MDTFNPGSKAQSMRSKWSTTIEAKLALTASMISPTDYLAFPIYFIYNGGAVLIPIFLVFLGLVGVPMVLLEVGVGQFMDRGTWCAWNIAPLFKGIGYMQTIINSQLVWLWAWYLMTIIFFCFELGVADPEDRSIFSHCQKGDEAQNSDTAELFGEYYSASNLTAEPCLLKSPWGERWNNFAYGFGSSTVGEVDGAQVLVMMLTLLLVCSIVAAGKRVIGKLSVICVVLPYLLTMMLFVRVLTLPGALDGLKYGLYPDWARVREPRTWKQAASFVLYFCAAGQGTSITVGSHNRFNNCFLLDCLLALALKYFMGVFIVITVLGAHGVLAHAVQLPFSEVVSGGLLTLPTVTEAFLMHTPAGGFWAACFLICVLLSCLSTGVWTVESAVVAVRDLLPRTPRFRLLRKKYVLTAVMAGPWCIYGLAYCTKDSAAAIIQLEQTAGNILVLLLLCLLECAAVGWLYGAMRFQRNWAVMQGCCGCPFPLVFWAIITPLVLFALLIFSMVLATIPYDAVMIASFLVAFLVILLSAIVLLFTRPGTLRQKWDIMTTPWDLAPHQMHPYNRRYDTIAMTTVPPQALSP